MKKFLISVVAVLLVCGGAWLSPVFAGEPIHNTIGGKLDAPKLIGLKQISKDLFFGLEAKKGLATNVFYDSFKGIEDDLGLEAYAKITYYGCWFNCPVSSVQINKITLPGNRQRSGFED